MLAGVPLADIALALGFQGHSHFTARFRRAFGETPSAVRAAAADATAAPDLIGRLLRRLRAGAQERPMSSRPARS